MKASDLRELKIEELVSREQELYNEIFGIRNKVRQEAGVNLKEYRVLRRELAQLKTVIQEKKVTQ